MFVLPLKHVKQKRVRSRKEAQGDMLTLNSNFAITTNTNSPFFVPCTVVSETEKAIQIRSFDTGKLIWLPKKSLKQLHTDVYTFQMWFRKVDNGKAITKAFNLIF